MRSRRRSPSEIRETVWPMVAAGELRPVMDVSVSAGTRPRPRTRWMEQGSHVGKIVLNIA